MSDASEDLALNLKGIMVWFQEISRLQVNFSKSCIYLVNENLISCDIGKLWCCKVGILPDTYLGMPLGAKFKEKGVWLSWIERLHDRLALWKRKFFTKGGQLVLIKSMLKNTPMYMFSLFVAPASAIKDMERIVDNLFWGVSQEKEILLMNLKKLCYLLTKEVSF